MYLRKQLKDLKDERETLNKLQKDQDKALEAWSTGQNFEGKCQTLREEIRKMKESIRELKQKHKQDEVEWRANHQRMVDLESRLRDAKKTAKKKPKDESKSQEAEVLNDLRKKFDIINKSKKTIEAKSKRRVEEAESSLKQLQDEQVTLSSKLKEKDQEIQLKQLKIKELTRTIKNLEQNSRPEEEKEREQSKESSGSVFEKKSVKRDDSRQDYVKESEGFFPTEVEEGNPSIFSKPNFQF
jgi:chromosome segregation ATPase